MNHAVVVVRTYLVGNEERWDRTGYMMDHSCRS